MRIVVTGGTGFIGRQLLASLTQRGASVVVLTRDPDRARQTLGDAHELVRWDGTGTAGLSVVDGAHAVVHLAGENVADKRWTESRKRALTESRVASTSAVASAIASAAHKPRVFVSASAVGYYGMRRDDAICREGDPPGDDFLGRLCVQWEAAADRARQAGVRVVHPRIGIVLGPEGGALEKMVRPFKAFVGGPIGSGTQWMSWIHELDVVAALEFLIDRDDLEGPVNLASPYPVTMKTFARTLGTVLRKPSSFAVPPFALKLALGDELAEMLLTGQRVEPQRLEYAGFRFRFPQLEPALVDALAVAGRAEAGGSSGSNRAVEPIARERSIR